jgi:hypothetical protein
VFIARPCSPLAVPGADGYPRRVVSSAALRQPGLTMKPYVWGALFFVIGLIVLGAVVAHMPTGPSPPPKPAAVPNAGVGGGTKSLGGGGVKSGSAGYDVSPDVVQIPKLAAPPPIAPAAPPGAPSLPSPLPVPVTPPPATR